MADEVDRGNERAQQLLDDALARIKPLPIVKAPESRDCDDCGDPIPRKRLLAVPHASRCIDCQNKEDRRLAGFGRPM